MSIQPTSDEGYIIGGQTYTGENNSEAYVLLIKTDDIGNEEWNKTFSGLSDALGLSVQQTDENGYIITGQTGNFQEYEASVLLLKTDQDGNEIWNTTFEFENYISVGFSIDQTINKGFIITGFFYTFGQAENHGILIKTDANGDEEWIKTFQLIENHSPEIPTITGPTEGKAGIDYEYTFATTDIDNDNVCYFIDWGDNTTDGWTEYQASGYELTVNHTWAEKGTYTVKVKAMDAYNEESDWATLEIKMPKNKLLLCQFFQKFLEDHPNIFPILRYLVETRGV